ncbi:acyl-CoA dehydrogenase [Desulfosporosinus sp.]|uniref:acyl-CoA dehydrogenase n=1 Tax=Desulfosporosinus sp. TaxID=157907 RepID=UPI000E8B4195|nr:acyl-CoA dehydrogenase [Desulfosporosinus sp.]MBC2723970.1 acyl-CoA dehydrogenase [Desulfosporosinus sp.]MBC2725251.1 acyl-CoA dehydrogenase [Desulfosporosinus sp.]HBV86230.1 acyl-CoA dehydrogenase [Desulfosporosinus sp.]
MASKFMYSNRDHKFIIKEWLDGKKILELKRFRDYISIEDVDGILDQSLKMSKEVVAPTNDDGDTIGAIFKDGKVTVPPSFHKAFKFIQENGWGASNSDVEGEGALPEILNQGVREFIIGANPSMSPYVGLSGGIASVIKAFGSPEQISLYTPKMFEGVWEGTMCLTEPGGGSDVGDMTTKAYPTENPLIYKVKGTKCFITGGDHDLTDNIIHLVLARVDGAAPGTKGLSLFIIPKVWVNEDGSLGESNDVSTVGIEHKMGLKGSSTAVLSFGEEGQCRGVLLGSPPDEKGIGQGIAQMFRMINGSRLDTGHSALAVATVAYNNAVDYAKQRIQGRPIHNPKAGRVPIIQHEDVRRMLLTQKATLEAMRAMIFKGYYYLDLIEFGDDPGDIKAAKRALEVITPLIKAYCSDQGWLMITEAIQVFGGYGFTEEYPVARQARDVKIYSIWEGTNFIQSMDLVGRKWSLDKGNVFKEWMMEMATFVQSNQNHKVFAREFEVLGKALMAYQDLVGTVLGYFKENIKLVPLYSTRILRITAELYGGCLLMQQALVAQEKLEQGNSDKAFYAGKVFSAKFYILNIVPDVAATVRIIKEGDTSAIDIPEEAF